MKKLDCRLKELVAIGASVTAHCEPCLRIHVQKALEAGATDEEVADAIEVGRLVARGAAAKINSAASEVCQIAPTAVPASVGCCC